MQLKNDSIYPTKCEPANRRPWSHHTPPSRPTWSRQTLNSTKIRREKSPPTTKTIHRLRQPNPQRHQIHNQRTKQILPLSRQTTHKPRPHRPLRTPTHSQQQPIRNVPTPRPSKTTKPNRWTALPWWILKRKPTKHALSRLQNCPRPQNRRYRPKQTSQRTYMMARSRLFVVALIIVAKSWSWFKLVYAQIPARLWANQKQLYAYPTI